MALTSFPFDDQDTTEGQYTTLFRELQDTGVVGSQDSDALSVSAHPTQLRAVVQPGAMIVRGHMLVLDEELEVALEPAGESVRYDLLVAKLDPAENGIDIVAITGTSNTAGPTPEQTDTDVWEEPLALLRVNPGSSVINTVTDLRRFAGSRVGCWTTDTRPANPRKGQTIGYNVTLGYHEFWDGSQWTSLVPNPVANSTRWNGYTLTVSTGTPSGSPSTDRIWIQPVS
jgi:hypothetical protein